MLENVSKIGLTVGIVGSINGRKRLQKSIYILKTLGFDYGESFKWGNYGVYSQELTNEIQTLVEAGYLYENSEADSSYTYSLSREGQDFIDKQSSAYPAMSKLEPVVKLLSEKSVGDLELFSSCLFVWEIDQTKDSMVDLVHYLKPQFDKRNVQDCVELADKMMRAESQDVKISLLAKL